MVLDRTENTKRNIIYGIVNKIIVLFFPFLIQTIMIYTIGIEYAGIRSLFTSILHVLNLSELGVGTAIVYSMYQPIAVDDTNTICALLNVYRKLYRCIGLVILTLGMILLPFIPRLINGSVPENTNIYVVYFLYLINTVVSYWLFAYKTSLLDAFQRVDIINIVSSISQIGMGIIQIVVLLVLKNFYIFLCITIIFTIINNILISYNTNRIFPQYNCKGAIRGDLKKDIKRKVIGIMISKVCNTTRNTFDNIYISMFFGLSLTAIYSNYMYVFNALTGIMAIVGNSLIAGIGNSIKLESVEKNMQDMLKINFLYMLISGWMSIYMLCMCQTFISIWLGQKMLLPFGILVLLSLYFYVTKMGAIRAVYSDAAGLFWENRYRTLAESIGNIVLNFIFIKWWGIYGIVLATILTLFFIGFLGSTKVIYKYYFKKGMKEFLIEHLYYFIITVLNAICTYYFCVLIHGNDIIVFLLRFIICSTVTPLIYFLFYCKTKIYKKTKSWLLPKLSCNKKKAVSRGRIDI